MALFVGGPYDGQDLPVDWEQDVYLPAPDQFESFGSKATMDQKWPHHYVADYSGETPFYRYRDNG